MKSIVAATAKMTISVFEVTKNEQGKYLPAIFTISNWTDEGALVSTLTEHDHWINKNGVDMPLKVMQVHAMKDKRSVFVIEFSDHKILGK